MSPSRRLANSGDDVSETGRLCLRPVEGVAGPAGPATPWFPRSSRSFRFANHPLANLVSSRGGRFSSTGRCECTGCHRYGTGVVDRADIDVRLASSADAETIRTIYNDTVNNSTATFDLVPRSLEDQQAWLVARSGVHAVLVAVERAASGTSSDLPDDSAPIDPDRSVVGFASLSPYRDRPGYATTVENSIYVAESHRGRGVGKILLGTLIDTARQHGFHAVMARIVDDHAASIALHRSIGFDLVGVEREVGRKFGRWLDVAVMQILL